MPVANTTSLYYDLTQRLNKILEQEYEELRFENGTLIPTEVDLELGATEISYDKITGWGDADLVNDIATNIPIVDLAVSEDKYPIYMVASGFAVSLNESFLDRRRDRRLHVAGLSLYNRRMRLAREVIAQRTDRFTALGIPGLNFPGILGNPLVSTENSTFDLYNAPFDDLVQFFVESIESMDDDNVSGLPTTMLLPPDPYKLLKSRRNPDGNMTAWKAIMEQYENLQIYKTSYLKADVLDESPIQRPTGAGKDRIILYARRSNVLNRHVYRQVASLAPPEYVRVEGLRRLFTMFSLITPGIIDRTTRVRYIDIPTKP